MNANFFSDLKFECYCENYPEIVLKLMRGAMKYFLKKLLGHEIFRSMVSWAMEFFFEKFVKPSAPSSSPPSTYILNVRSLSLMKLFLETVLPLIECVFKTSADIKLLGTNNL